MLIVAHLTDIHIKGDLDPILSRATEIGAAIASHAFKAKSIVIVVSGDISYSGSSAQFAIAEIFLRNIESRLRLDFEGEVKFVLVPGNHDCDFSDAQGVRNALLKSISEKPQEVPGADILNACTKIQDAFFDFKEKFTGTKYIGKERLRYQDSIGLDGIVVRFDCINLSWVSQKKEDQIRFPATVLPEDNSHGEIVVSVMHHPFNWLHPSDYRDFRRRVKARSNFILSGHEHQWNVIESDEAEAGEVIHFEGAVLQCDDPEVSGFAVIELNVTSREYRGVRYQWQGDSYERHEIPGWSAMRSFQLQAPSGAWVFTREFESFICDLGITVRVGGREEVSLRDLYVFPDLELAADDRSDAAEIFGENVVSSDENSKGFVLLGDDRCGRTSLLKQLSVKYLDKSKVPIFISAEKFRHATDDGIEAVLDVAIRGQYGHPICRYFQLPFSDRVLLVDDFDEVPIKSEKIRRQLLSRLRDMFQILVLGVSDVFDSTYLVEGDEGGVYNALPKYRMLPFGRFSRAKLIGKWVTLDSDEFLSAEERVRRIDLATKHVEAVMKWGVVPCYPVYLITLLQAHKGGSPEQFKEGGLGYYYEYLISDSMLKSGVPKGQLTAADQYCSRLAWEMRTRSRSFLSIDELDRFDDDFSRSWIRLDFKSLRESLVLARVINVFGDSIEFRYSHVYYFFIARYISDNFDQDEMSDFVESAASHLYVRSNAKILIFLAHFSSKGIVIDKIVETLRSQFDGQPLARFALRNESVEAMLRQLPVIVYKGGDPELHREQEAMAQDALGTNVNDGLVEEPEDVSVLSLTARLTVVFKAIEILGQILRAQYSRIRREKRQQVITEMLNAPLRALEEFYDELRSNPEGFVDIFERELSESDADKNDLEARRDIAQRIVGSLVLGVTFGFIRKSAECVGADVLRDDLVQAVESNRDLGQMLIKLAASLDGQHDLPRAEIERVRHLGQGSLIVDRVVQVLVVYRMYMFRTSFSDIRWAHDVLNLSHGVKVRALLSSSVGRKTGKD